MWTSKLYFKNTSTLLDNNFIILYFYMAYQPVVGQGIYFIAHSRLHLDKTNSVELHWTSDQQEAGTCT